MISCSLCLWVADGWKNHCWCKRMCKKWALGMFFFICGDPRFGVFSSCHIFFSNLYQKWQTGDRLYRSIQIPRKIAIRMFCMWGDPRVRVFYFFIKMTTFPKNILISLFALLYFQLVAYSFCCKLLSAVHFLLLFQEFENPKKDRLFFLMNNLMGCTKFNK